MPEFKEMFFVDAMCTRVEAAAIEGRMYKNPGKLLHLYGSSYQRHKIMLVISKRLLFFPTSNISFFGCFGCVVFSEISGSMEL